MAIDIKVPSVGESISEGTLVRWLKKDGDQVNAGDALFELETEKASTEVPAPADGILHPKAKEGDTVAIGAVVGTIDPAGAAKPAGSSKPREASKPAKESAKPVEKETKVSPAGRRMAAEEKVDPA